MGDLLRIDLTTGAITEETVPRDLITAVHRRQGHRHLPALAGGRSRRGPHEPAEQADLHARSHGRHHACSAATGTRVYFVSPLTGGYCECYSGGNVTPQFARTGYKVVILEGASQRPGLRRDLGEGRRHPSGRRRVGPRHLRGRREARRQGRRAQGSGLRHRAGRREPGALRLHREQQVAQPGTGRSRRGHGLQEGQGPGLPRRPPRRGGAPRGVQGAHQGHGRARPRRSRRGRLSSRRHRQHGAHAQQRPHASPRATGPRAGWTTSSRSPWSTCASTSTRSTAPARPASCSASSSTPCRRATATPACRSRVRSTRRSTSSEACARSSTSARSCTSTTSATASAWTPCRPATSAGWRSRRASAASWTSASLGATPRAWPTSSG